MTYKQIFLFLIASVLFSCGQVEDKNNLKSISIDQIHLKFPEELKHKNGELFDVDTLVAFIDGLHFEVTPSGKLNWKNNSSDTIYLTKEADVDIEGGYLLYSADTLYVFYTETDGEGATSRLEKIDLQARRSIWQTDLYGFNLGLPYVRGNYVYVTTIGHVGKINLTTGSYEFECSELYDHQKYSFNAFDTIIFRDTLTFFLANNRSGKRIDTVIVNEMTRTYMTRK